MQLSKGHTKNPWHFNGQDWKKILSRSKERVGLDNIGIVAAGVAFYAFLSIFPLLAAFVGIYGLAASPNDVIQLLESAKGIVPKEIISIFEIQLTRLAEQNQAAGLAAAFGFLAAIWAGSRAVKGMMAALNITYDERETRNILKKNATALLLTLGGVLTASVCVFLLAGLPILENIFPWLSGLPIQIARWSLLALIIITALSVLYRWAPDRKKVKWRWITPGTSLAALVWLLASGLFSWYVSSFGNYNKTYGSIGAIAIMMLWLSLSAFFFLLGAEMDSEMERQAGMLEKKVKKKAT